jgi:hypothetical protein
MVQNGSRLKNLAISLLNTKTERDGQKKVGASQISNPCTKHLALALAGVEQEPSKYWLGGKIGTAVHSALELAIEHSDAEELKGAVVEEKITLGEIPGYGIVSSKPDLILPAINHLVDWKTSTRAKTKKIQAWVDGVKQDASTTYTMQKYIGQTQLYAWGATALGYQIDNISLVFVNRDGTSDSDVLEYTFAYDESIAVALWDRLVVLWEELQTGVHPESYAGHPECFNCSVSGLV